MDTAQIITISGFIFTGFTATLAAFLTLFAQVRKLKQDKAKDDQDRVDNQPEKEASAAKVMADAFAAAIAPLRKELKDVREELTTANAKIEKLTAVVSDYSKGVDMLIEQLKAKGEIPVYTKKPHSDIIQEEQF